jgi:hypothetical protein
MALKISSYERMAVQAEARTGARQFAAVRDAINGKQPFPAQIRVLLELARRGHVDLNALAAAGAGHGAR